MALEWLLVGSVAGIAIAGAEVAVRERMRSQFETPLQFHRTLSKISPPEGSTCAICGVVVHDDNVRVAYVSPKLKTHLLVCDRLECLMKYSQGVDGEDFQQELMVE